MNHSFRLNIISGKYDAVPAAIAGFLIIQALAQHSGIGVSPDSVVYLSTAANIRDHHLMNDFTNMPVMDFPVLYPIFLAVLTFLTGKNGQTIGPFLNGALFAALICICGWMMERFSNSSRWYKRTILAFIVLSPCLLEVYSMIWSETLFILLSVLFMIGCHRYFRTHSLRILVLTALIAGLASVTRYAGISLIGMGGLLLVCDGRLPFGKRSIAKKMGHILSFGLVAIIPLAANLYRNSRLTGTLTGYREKGLRSFVTNLHDFGSVFCDWLPFFRERYGAASLVAIVFIALITILFIWRLIRRIGFFSIDTIALTYFVVYAAFILFSATVSRFQALDSRLLSPLFLPWLWGSTCWIPGALARCHDRRWKHSWITVVFAASCCFLWGELETFGQNWNGIHYAGIPGYTEDQWQSSATMTYVRQNKAFLQAQGPIYSDAFEGLWFLAGVTSDIIPHKDNPEDIGYLIREKRFTVIWFDDSQNNDLLDMDYIKEHKTLLKEQHFVDGAIYFFVADSTSVR